MVAYSKSIKHLSLLMSSQLPVSSSPSIPSPQKGLTWCCHLSFLSTCTSPSNLFTELTAARTALFKFHHPKFTNDSKAVSRYSMFSSCSV